MKRLFPKREYTHLSKWALWRWKDIPSHGKEYMTRLYVLVCPLGTLMINWIDAKDGQHMHDHPVHFISFIIKGRYKEELLRPDNANETYVQVRKWFNFVPADRRHRIVGVKRGTITLVFTSPTGS